jgi:hypothetical protein
MTRFRGWLARFWNWWSDANATKVIALIRVLAYIILLVLAVSSDYRLWSLEQWWHDLIPTGGLVVDPSYRLGGGLWTLLRGGT